MTPATLAQIHAAAFAESQRAWREAEFAALLVQRGVRVVSRPNGFALLRLIPPEAEILTFAVAPRAQRRGLGRALLDDAVGLAGDSGIERLFLEVAADNAAAIALYAGAGFVVTGRRPAYYRRPDGSSQDALMMARSVSA